MGGILSFTRRRRRPWYRRWRAIELLVVLAVIGFLVVGRLPPSVQNPASENAGSPSTTSVASLKDSTTAPVVFDMCDPPPHRDCVIDGDTFYLGTQSIRIADIDAPETHPSHCDEEAKLGEGATRRLLVLLNVGPFDLHNIDRDEDQYGRKLRVVTRDGHSLGNQLVSEGWHAHGRDGESLGAGKQSSS